MDMRLFKRGSTYYIEFGRARKRSLKTSDKREAQRLFNEIKKRDLQKKLFILDQRQRISISEFKKKFISHPDRRNLSDKTLEGDELAFRLLKDALGDIPLKLVNKEAILKFKTVSIKRVKPVSVNTYLRHIKSGLRWAKDEEYIDKVPVIKMFKLGKPLPRHLSPEEIETILNYAKKIKPEMYRIIQFALYTGCRRAEIIKARYEHIANGTILIKGKGDKERLIPLLPQALDIQQDIGKVFSYKHVSTVSNYFRKIVNTCGIKTRFHDLRHTAGTMMLSKKIPLGVIQKILGHADIRTTQIYSQVLAESMAEEMKKLNYDK